MSCMKLKTNRNWGVSHYVLQPHPIFQATASKVLTNSSKHITFHPLLSRHPYLSSRKKNSQRCDDVIMWCHHVIISSYCHVVMSSCHHFVVCKKNHQRGDVFISNDNDSNSITTSLSHASSSIHPL
jgi:hypothetical protein